MKQVKTAMYVQTAYMVGMGLGSLFMPGTILPLFGFAPPADVWIRVLAAMILGFAYVNYRCTVQEVVPYFRASVTGRVLFCGMLVTIGALGLTQPAVFLLAAMETALAIWAWTGLKKLNA